MMSKRMILTMKVMMSMQAKIAMSLMISIAGVDSIRKAIVIVSRRVSTLKMSRKIAVEIAAEIAMMKRTL
jgi:hypothetical protein